MFITTERDHSWNLPEPWIIFQQWQEAKEQLISLFNLQELQLLSNKNLLKLGKQLERHILDLLM